MDTVTTAYSRMAMRSLLALDQRQRARAVGVAEALFEQKIAQPATPPVGQEGNGAVGQEGNDADQPDPGEHDELVDTEAEPEAGGAAMDNDAGDGADKPEIAMVPYGGNGVLHLVKYSPTGDLVVAIKDNSVTVVALIDVMQGLKRDADHD
ncbi:MAG: hypothetical protein ACTSUY_03565 [Alphaproteobacteria bacterium]